MPVLVKADTGEAEDLPDQQAQIAVATGTHKIPLIDPQGNPVMADVDEARDSIQDGYTQPNPKQLKNLLDQTKYGTTAETAKAAGEAAASAATFGLSTAAERALGVNPEDIQGRREVLEQRHPIGKVAAELAGLAGSALIPGIGEANVLEKAGAGAAGLASKIGLPIAQELALPAGAISVIDKVGTPAVKLATESALFQMGDEASKMFASDPHQTAETALANVKDAGLYGAVLGGAFGAVSPLWAAASETRLGRMLGQVKERLNGVVKNAPSQDMAQMIERSGVEVPETVRAALGTSPDVRQAFQELIESGNDFGKFTREDLSKFYTKANESILGSFGKTAEDAGKEFDAYESAKQLRDTLTQEIRDAVKPAAEKFEKIKKEFSTVPFTDSAQAELSNELGRINLKYAISPSSPEFQKINTIIKELPNIKTLEDLRNFQSAHLGDIANKQLWTINAPVRNAMRELEEKILVDTLAKDSPELLVDHMAARDQYRSAMSAIDSLNDRLHVGRYSGPDTFLHALSEMKPEDILRRLSPTKDAGLLDLLSSTFPKTATEVKANIVDQLISKAAQKPPYGQPINSTALFRQMQEWSPQLRQFVASPEAIQRLDAIKGLMQSVPLRMGPSGTPVTLDAIWSNVMAGAGGMASALTGDHSLKGFGVGWLIGKIAKLVSRDAPDAIKYATLKYLGSPQQTNPKAFKSMVDFAHSVINGETIIQKATKNIFKEGEVLAPSKYIDDKKREKLDNKIKDFQTNINGFMDLNIGSDIGHYMPESTIALNSAVGRAVNYLNQIRPKSDKLAPLDKDMPPSAAEVARYNRVFDVVNHPVVALENIKRGTLTEDQVVALRTVYPSLYQNMVNKINAELVDHVANGKDVPYKTRLNLSLFLGQSLDATTLPQSIISAQPMPSVAPQPQTKQKGSMKQVSKIAQASMTRSEAADMHRIMRG